MTKSDLCAILILSLASLCVVFDLKLGKAPQDQARPDGKAPILPGQEMADPGKTESAIFFPWSRLRLIVHPGEAAHRNGGRHQAGGEADGDSES